MRSIQFYNGIANINSPVIPHPEFPAFGGNNNKADYGGTMAAACAFLWYCSHHYNFEEKSDGKLALSATAEAVYQLLVSFYNKQVILIRKKFFFFCQSSGKFWLLGKKCLAQAIFSYKKMDFPQKNPSSRSRSSHGTRDPLKRFGWHDFAIL